MTTPDPSRDSDTPIKRYSIAANNLGGCIATEDEYGAWVSFIDVHEIGRKMQGLMRQIQIRDAELAAEKAKGERLQHEVNVLRQYGNKDCTGMADTALEEYYAAKGGEE